MEIRARVMSEMETDRVLGFSTNKDGLGFVITIDMLTKLKVAQDAKTLKAVGNFLEQFTEGDIYGDERTGDYMLFQMPPKIFKALKQGKMPSKEE